MAVRFISPAELMQAKIDEAKRKVRVNAPVSGNRQVMGVRVNYRAGLRAALKESASLHTSATSTIQ